MTVLLTDRFVKALKPRPKRYYVRDKKVTGLEVGVSPDGSKNWSVRYRIHGQQRRFKLGEFPRVSLSISRERANEELRKIDGASIRRSSGLPNAEESNRRTAIASRGFARLTSSATPSRESVRGATTRARSTARFSFMVATAARC